MLFLSSFVSATLEDNLVACYDFEDDSDYLGVHNGSSVSLNFVSGKVGNAISFNSGADTFIIPDSSDFDMSTGFTFDFWVNPSSYPQTSIPFVDKMTTWTGSNNGYSISIQDAGQATPKLRTRVDASNYAVAYTVGTGAWTNLAYTWNGSYFCFYVNGSQEGGCQAYSGDFGTSDVDLLIGSFNGLSNSSYYYLGLFDQLIVYDVAKSEADLSSMYNSGSGLSCSDVEGALEDVSLNVFNSVEFYGYNGTEIRLNYTVSVWNNMSVDFNSTTLDLDDRFDNGSAITIDLLANNIFSQSFTNVSARGSSDVLINLSAPTIFHDSGDTYNMSGVGLPLRVLNPFSVNNLVSCISTIGSGCGVNIHNNCASVMLG